MKSLAEKKLMVATQYHFVDSVDPANTTQKNTAPQLSFYCLGLLTKLLYLIFPYAKNIQYIAILVTIVLNKSTWGVKKCGANQKQHCKQAGATKRF